MRCDIFLLLHSLELSHPRLATVFQLTPSGNSPYLPLCSISTTGQAIGMPTGFSMVLDLCIQSVSATYHFWQLYAILMELLVSSASSWIILLYYIHSSITVIEKKANCKSACDANDCVISGATKSQSFYI